MEDADTTHRLDPDLSRPPKIHPPFTQKVRQRILAVAKIIRKKWPWENKNIQFRELFVTPEDHRYVRKLLAAVGRRHTLAICRYLTRHQGYFGPDVTALLHFRRP